MKMRAGILERKSEIYGQDNLDDLQMRTEEELYKCFSFFFLPSFLLLPTFFLLTHFLLLLLLSFLLLSLHLSLYFCFYFFSILFLRVNSTFCILLFLLFLIFSAFLSLSIFFLIFFSSFYFSSSVSSPLKTGQGQIYSQTTIYLVYLIRQDTGV